jgi:hypothetical protein
VPIAEVLRPSFSGIRRRVPEFARLNISFAGGVEKEIYVIWCKIAIAAQSTKPSVTDGVKLAYRN